MPPNTNAWNKAGLTIDINLLADARGGGVSVHIWDQTTATSTYVAHVQTSALEPALAELVPKVTSYLSHRNDPK